MRLPWPKSSHPPQTILDRLLCARLARRRNSLDVVEPVEGILHRLPPGGQRCGLRSGGVPVTRLGRSLRVPRVAPMGGPRVVAGREDDDDADDDGEGDDDGRIVAG